jgi:hypothetical protein
MAEQCPDLRLPLGGSGLTGNQFITPFNTGEYHFILFSKSSAAKQPFHVYQSKPWALIKTH